MDNNTLQERIKDLQQEVIALRTAKAAGLLLKAETYIVNDYEYITGLTKITYEAGAQPIITTNYSGIQGSLFAPEGNEQYFYYSGSGAIGTLVLQSTRKILSVEWVSA